FEQLDRTFAHGVGELAAHAGTVPRDTVGTSRGCIVIPDDLKDVAARADELRAKYLYERDKRIETRPDGNAQFLELKGVLADFDKDPYVEPGFTRPALVEETDVVIVGAGFGGMMTAAHLFKHGVHDYRII